MKMFLFPPVLAMTMALCFMPFIHQAQTVTVLDFSTRKPLAGVSISNLKGEAASITDEQGKAQLDAYKGQCLRYSLLGYKSFLDTLNADATVMLREGVIGLDEVVVSASKFEERKSDVPQQIRIIGSREVAFQNQPTSADMLLQSGQVFVQKSQLGGGSPVMRGFEANKVLIVVDGVRMNNAMFRGGHLQNVLRIDPNMLDRTELVFGPGSVVYGSDALGGVVHLHTRTPSFAQGEKPLVQAGSFVRYATAANERTAHVHASIAGKRVAYVGGFTYSLFDDLRQGNIRNSAMGSLGLRSTYVQRINGKDSVVNNPNPNIQRFSGYNQWDMMHKLIIKQNKAITHTLNFQFSTTNQVPRYDRLTDRRNGQLRFAEWYYGPETRLMGSYAFTWKQKTLLFDRLQMVGAYQKFKESRHDRSFGNPNRNNRLEDLDLYTLNLDASKQVGEHEIRYGMEEAFNRLTSTAFAENIDTQVRQPLNTRYPNGGSRMNTLAAYVTHAWEASERLVLTQGIRYTNIHLGAEFSDKTFFPFPFSSISQQSSAINGNLGLVYRPQESLNVTLHAASGFRAPNVDDLAKVFESGNGTLIVPNPNLQPEYTYNLDLGITKTFAERVRLEASGFYTWYRNAITTQPFLYEGKSQLSYNGVTSLVVASQNASKAYLYGAQAGVWADVGSHFSASATATYTYGRIETDSTDYPLDHIPPVYGKLSAIYRTGILKAEVFSLFNGWKRISQYNMVGEDNPQYATAQGTPSWWTLNVRTSFQLGKYLQLQASLENILDRNYRCFASGISAPGRNFMLTLRAEY
jgi:hemoglobin/transferrin/lactoferrin receptor protein